MKKITLALLVLLTALTSNSQSIVPRGTPTNTMQDYRLDVKNNLVVPRYLDTATANLTANKGLDSSGALIKTYNPDAIWVRQSNPKRWFNLSGLSSGGTLATVATTGAYADLLGKPTIPAAQVQSDWNATSGLGVILNKPTSANVVAMTVATLRTTNTTTNSVYNLIDYGGGQVRDLGLNDGTYVDDTAMHIISANSHVLQREFSGMLNAKWFGVIGDGFHNDAPELNAAFNAAAGRTLDISGMTIKVTSQGGYALIMHKNVNLYADKARSAIIRADNCADSTAILRIDVNTNGGLLDVRDMKIENISMFHNAGGKNGVEIIGTMSNTQFLMTGCNITAGINGDAVYATNLSFGGFEKNTFSPSIFLSHVADGTRIVDNTFFGNKCAITLDADYGTYNHIIQNNVMPNRDGAIHIINGSQVKILNNQIEHALLQGISQGNKFSHIWIEGRNYTSKNITIEDNNGGGGTNLNHFITIDNATKTYVDKVLMNATDTADVVFGPLSFDNYVYPNSSYQGNISHARPNGLEYIDSGTNNYHPRFGHFISSYDTIRNGFIASKFYVDSIKSTFTSGSSITIGAANYIQKVTGSSAISNSQLYDNGTNILVGGTTPVFGKFQIDGDFFTRRGLTGIRTTEASDLGAFNGHVLEAVDNNMSVRKNLYLEGDNVYLNGAGGNRVIVGTNPDNGVDKLQVTGTVSASPAVLDNQLPTLGQVNLTNTNNYFDDAGAAKTGLALRNSDNVLSGLADPTTGQSITYSKVTTQPEGFAINDGWIDGVMYRKKGSEYFLRNIDHEVNVKWFNAKGDAVYMEQDAGVDFGKVTQRDHSTLATDNTVAFQKAIDFIHNYSLPTFAQAGGVSIGYRTKKLKLVIPAGSYLITSPEVFTKLRGAVTGYADAGFTIEGDGQNSTEIIYRNDGDTSKFLIENGNAWNGIVFKDITFRCVTGKEKIYHETSTGTAGFTTFENVGFQNYKVAAEIGGSLNADRGTFRNVVAVSAVPGNTFFKINNPQGIGFVFDHVSITETDGTVFDVYATGSNTLTGASSVELFGNSCLYRVHPVDLGEQENPVFTSYSTKIELHGTSILADVTGAFINIYSSNHNTNFSTAPYSVILRNSLAGIRFFGSEFRDFKTAIIQNQVAGSGRNKAGLEFHSSRFRGVNWQATNISYFLSDFTTPTVDTIANVVFDNPIFYDDGNAAGYSITTNNKPITLQGSSVLVPTKIGVNTTSPTALIHAQNTINAGSSIKVQNLSNGTLAEADFRALNDIGTETQFGTLSSGATPYNNLVANGGFIYSASPAGFSILGDAGPVRISGGGAASGLTINATSVTAAGTVSASRATQPTELLRKDQLDSVLYNTEVDSVNLKHFADATGHTVTGTLAETTVYSRTIPANTLGPNGYMEFKWFVTLDSVTLVSIYIGGNLVAKANLGGIQGFRGFSSYSNRGAQNVGFSPWPDYNYQATGQMLHTIQTYTLDTSTPLDLVVTLTTTKTAALEDFQAFFYH